MRLAPRRRHLAIVVAFLPVLLSLGPNDTLAQLEIESTSWGVAPFAPLATDPDSLGRSVSLQLTSDCDLDGSANLSSYVGGSPLDVGVWFHQLRRDTQSELITQSDYDQAISRLNSAFSPAGISFHISGINEQVVDGNPALGRLWTGPADPAALSFQRLHSHDPDRYLNVYITDLYDESLSQARLAGWATAPFYLELWSAADAVGVDRTAFLAGIDYPGGLGFNEGDAIVTLVGQYFGLLPTVSLHCDSNGGVDCYTSGDLICDTTDVGTEDLAGSPPAYGGCPTVPQYGCDGAEIDTSNFMSGYSDACRSVFSPEQLMRVRCVAESVRASLFSDQSYERVPVDWALGNVASASAGDFNDDGFDDLLLLGSEAGVARLCPGGAMGLGAPLVSAGFGLASVTGVFTCDTNGDRILDVATVGTVPATGALALEIATGDGTGHFFQSTLYDLPPDITETFALSAVDFDADGSLEFLVGAHPRPLLLRPTSVGVDDLSSRVPFQNETNSVYDIAVGNADGVEKLDLALATDQGTYVATYHDFGLFAAYANPYLIAWTSVGSGEDVDWIDLDGDLTDELVMSRIALSTPLAYSYLEVAKNVDGVMEWEDPLATPSPAYSNLPGFTLAPLGTVFLSAPDGEGNAVYVFRAGASIQEIINLDPAYERDSVHLQGVDGQFLQQSFSNAFPTWCAVRGDWNGDGLDDLVAVPAHGLPHVPEAIYLGIGSPGKSFSVHLAGAGNNTSGIGAKVSVTLASGAKRSTRIGSGHGRFSSNAPSANFRLSQADEVASVNVAWASGAAETQSIATGAVSASFFEPGVSLVDVSSAAGLENATAAYATAFKDYESDAPGFAVSFDADATKHYRRFGVSGGIPQHSNEATGQGFSGTASERGMSLADYDGDSDLDMFVAHEVSPRLYEKRPGSPPYVDVAGSVAVDATTFYQSTLDSWSGAWGDYDGDGHLDLYVTRADAPPIGQRHTYASIDGRGAKDVLLHNRGYAGVGFDDVTAASGIYDVISETVSASWSDVDNDRDLDLFVCWLGGLESGMTLGWSPLYVNNGDGTFTDQSFVAGGAGSSPSPEFLRLGYVNAVAWPDMNNDGYVDIALARENSTGAGNTQNVLVYMNKGAADPGSLIDEPAGRPNSTEPMSDLRVADLDNNTVADLIYSPTGSATEHIYMGYASEGGAVWVEQAETLGLRGSPGGTLLAADLNDDGDTDLFLGDSYWKTTAADGSESNGNNYLKVGLQNNSRLGGTWNDGNALEGVGARVLLECPATGVLPALTRTFMVDGGSGRGGQEDRLLTIGLGSRESGTLTVFWPDGATTVRAFNNTDINNASSPIDITDVHAPGLVGSTVTGYSQPNPDGTMNWVFEWRTDHTTDESLDKIVVRAKAGKFGVPPLCDITETTLRPTTYKVAHTVVASGARLLHKMVWEDQICNAPCTYTFDVYSTFNGDVDSKLVTQLDVPVCVQQQ